MINVFKIYVHNKKLFFFSLILLAIFLIYIPVNFNLAFDLSYYLAQEFTTSNDSFKNTIFDYSSRLGFLIHLKIVLSILKDKVDFIFFFFFIYIFFFIFVFFKYISGFFDFKITTISLSLLIFSPLTIFWLPRHIDIIWPCYFFLFLFFFDKQKNFYAILSSFFLIITLFTKGVVILFLFFPFFYSIFIEKKTIRYLLTFYISFIIFFVLIKLLLNNYYLTNDYNFFLGINLVTEYLSSYPTNNFFLNTIYFFFSGFFNFFFNLEAKRGIIFENIFLIFSIFYFINLIFTRSTIAGKEKKFIKIFILVLFLFLPFLIYFGSVGARYSQNFVIISFLYIFAVLFIKKKFNKKNFYTLMIFFIIINFFLLDFTKRNKFIIKNNYFLSIISKKEKKIPSRAEVYNYSNHTNYILSSKERIMIPNALLLSRLIILTEGKKELFSLPYNQIAIFRYWPYYDKIISNKYKFNYITLFNANHERLSSSRKLPLALLSDERIFNYIQKNKIAEIHVSNFHIDKNLNDYFEKSVNFKKKGEIKISGKKKFYIYEINGSYRDENNRYIDKYAKNFIEKIKITKIKKKYLDKINRLKFIY